MPITVIEHWHLNDDAARDAFAVMQQMDDLLEDNAHDHPGWDGHARFYQPTDDPHRVLMLYSWRTRAEAEALLASEEPLLRDFVAQHCTRDRQVEFADELHVDV